MTVAFNDPSHIVGVVHWPLSTIWMWRNKKRNLMPHKAIVGFFYLFFFQSVTTHRLTLHCCWAAKIVNSWHRSHLEKLLSFLLTKKRKVRDAHFHHQPREKELNANLYSREGDMVLYESIVFSHRKKSFGVIPVSLGCFTVSWGSIESQSVDDWH